MTDDEAWMRENDQVHRYARDIDRLEPRLSFVKSLVRMLLCEVRYGKPHHEDTLAAVERNLTSQIHLMYRLSERQEECKCGKCRYPPFLQTSQDGEKD